MRLAEYRRRIRRKRRVKVLKDWNFGALREAWNAIDPNDEIATTWADAEREFPGCSAQWDAQSGEQWVDGRDHLTIVIHELDGHDVERVTQMGGRATKGRKTLAIGCGHEEPFGWALWMSRDGVNTWVFL